MAAKNTAYMLIMNWTLGPVPPGLDLPCRLWNGVLDRDGYGRAAFKGRRIQAHKFIWEHYRGIIPEGFELDHLCRTRSCVEMTHLELVTKSVNLQRRQFGGLLKES